MPTYYPQLSYMLQKELKNEFDAAFPEDPTLISEEEVAANAVEQFSRWIYFWHTRKPVIQGDIFRSNPESQLRLSICEQALIGLLEQSKQYGVTVASIEKFINENIINKALVDGSASSSPASVFRLNPPGANNKPVIRNYSNLQKRTFLVERNLYSYQIAAHFNEGVPTQYFQFECSRDASEEDFVRQIFYNTAEHLSLLTHVVCSQEHVDKDSDFSPFLQNRVDMSYRFDDRNANAIENPVGKKWYQFWHRFTALLSSGEHLFSPRFLEIEARESVPLLMSANEECKSDSSSGALIEPNNSINSSNVAESAADVARKLRNMRKRNKKSKKH